MLEFDLPKIIANFARDPQRIAIHDQNISYSQLNDNANKMANFLLKEGVKKGDLIAIFIDSISDFVTMILAIWKIGAFYIPISAKGNSNTIREILAATGPKYLLFPATSARLAQVFQTDNLKSLIYSQLEAQEQSPLFNSTVELNPEDPAYIMPTSGSTGVPKMPLLSHGGIYYCVKAHREMLKLLGDDRFLQIAKPEFDASLIEILMALAVGGTLYSVSDEIREDDRKLAAFIQHHKINIAILVPSKLKKFSPQDFPALKSIIVTGEKFSADLVQPWYLANINVINGYGLTETTICATLGKYNGEELTIGSAIEGSQLYLLELKDGDPSKIDFTKLKPVENKQEGEIYISGKCLAKEYWRDINRTKERFVYITDPKSKKIILAYRTGDCAIRSTTNKNEFIITRRVDNQLKLYGQRLEPEHIEAKLKDLLLNNAKFIKDAYVVGAVKNSTLYLVAYIISFHNSQKVPLDILRNMLREKLPHFMIPSAMEYLDEKQLPLITNGKVDRKKLAEIAEKEIPFICSSKKEPPKSAVEIKIATIWAEILQIPVANINLDDDFFCRGGSSLNTSELLAKLGQNFPAGKKLLPLFAYQFSTLRLMSSYIETPTIKRLSGKNKPNSIYLVHSLTGEGWLEYTELANLLGTHYQVHAYRSTNICSKILQRNGIPGLAKYYVDCLLASGKFTTHDEILLMGYSSGGLIALEMGCDLIVRGYTLTKIMLLDTPAPHLITTEEITDIKKRMPNLSPFSLTLLDAEQQYARTPFPENSVPENIHLIVTTDSQKKYKLHDLDWTKWLNKPLTYDTIDNDHFNIIKDIELVSKIKNVFKPQSSLYNKIQGIEDSNNDFIGRKKDSADLVTKLTPEEHNKQKRCIVTINGYHGVGKSRLAKEFALQHKQEYQIIWLVDTKAGIISIEAFMTLQISLTTELIQ